MLISENYIHNKDYLNVLQKISRVITDIKFNEVRENKIKESTILEIDYFFIKVKDIFFEMASQGTEFNLILQLLKISIAYRFNRIFYKNGVHMSVYLTQMMLQNEKLFEDKDWLIFLHTLSRKNVNLPNNLKSQLYVIAIRCIEKAPGYYPLKHLFFFFLNKFQSDFNEDTLQSVSLKAIQLCVKNNYMNELKYLYEKINKKNLLFEAANELSNYDTILNLSSLAEQGQNLKGEEKRTSNLTKKPAEDEGRLINLSKLKDNYENIEEIEEKESNMRKV
jgi:hypothetical protein